jgi:hypothetical protein
MAKELLPLTCFALALGFIPCVYADEDGRVAADYRILLQASQLRVASFGNSALGSASYQADPSLRAVAPRALSSVGAAVGLAPLKMLPQWNFELFMDQTARLGGTVGTFAALNALSGDRSLQGTGAQLPIQVTGQLMRRTGVGAARTFMPIATTWGGLSVRTGMRVFVVTQFRAIDASGTLTETTAGSTQLQATAQDIQQGGTSLYLNPEKTSGAGITFHAEATLGSLERSHLTLSVRDVGPAVSLAHVLQTNRTINSNTLTYDASGYAQFAPAVSGKYTDTAYKAKQYPSAAMLGAVEYSPAVQWLGRVHYSYPVTQYAGGAQWRTAGETQLQALLYVGPYLPTSAALAWQHRSFGIQWRGDNLSPSKAKIWGLDGRINF